MAEARTEHGRRKWLVADMCEKNENSKIDFVISWVDGNDSEWQKEKNIYEAEHSGSEMFDTWSNPSFRYRDWGTLRYWFRGVEQCAPWVNNIYFVTWGHMPPWLNLKHPKLKIVRHGDYIPEKYLPTFNSHTIEWNMHRIPELTEKFVYFNDDCFLVNPVKEADFFKGGYPCATAGTGIVLMEADDGSADINNMRIINKYFDKKEVLKKNWRKWFLPRYRSRLLRTLLLLPWDYFTGMYCDHLCCPHLKSTFETLWDLEQDLLDNTCGCRFREGHNVNQWLAAGWNIVSGNFAPKGVKFGKSFFKEVDKEICSAIVRSKYKYICINDVECDVESFLRQKSILQEAFEARFPQKSGFEK